MDLLVVTHLRRFRPFIERVVICIFNDSVWIFGEDIDYGLVTAAWIVVVS